MEKVEGGYSIDVLCNVGERQKVLHVMSMLPTMNSIVVEEGRLPKTKEECLVDVDFLTANGYKIGDQIHLESGRVEEDLSESLKADTYTIVEMCIRDRNNIMTIRSYFSVIWELSRL